MHSGWMLLGFLGDFPPGMSEVEVGGRPLIVVRDEAGIGVFDGVCPHRGARLARGRLDGGSVICAFHGHAIGLGGAAAPKNGARFTAGAYHTFEVAELVFVQMGQTRGAPNCGFEGTIRQLREDHAVVHGFAMDVPADPATVVENAFDLSHFGPVHGVPDVQAPQPVDADWRKAGFTCENGAFRVSASPWDPEPTGTAIEIGYRSTAFSPNLVLSDQTGSRPYRFLVGALPLGPPRRSRVRLALLLPREDAGRESVLHNIEWLLGAMETQLEADCAIWAGLPEKPVRNLAPGEDAIATFWRFCELFPDLDPRESLA